MIKPLVNPASTMTYSHNDEFIQSHLELADAARSRDMYKQPERSPRKQGRVLEKLTSAVRRMSRKSIEDFADFTAPKDHFATKVSFRLIEYQDVSTQRRSHAGSTHNTMEVINVRRHISAPVSSTQALIAGTSDPDHHHADSTTPSRRRTITRLLSLSPRDKSGSFEAHGDDGTLDCDAAAKAASRHNMLEATLLVAKKLSAPLSGEHMVSSSDRAGMALLKQRKASSKPREEQDPQPAEPYHGPSDVQQGAMELALILGARSQSSGSNNNCKRSSLATNAASLRVTLARMDAILRSRRAASDA